jgi:pyrophosphate--fructose-6-phosphate 1-phosphotransferase
MTSFKEMRQKAKIQIIPELEIFEKGSKLRVGVLFSGGPAAGGSNVVAGLFDALKEIHPESELIGFIGGPSGILEENFKILSNSDIDAVRNLGGFDLLGTGRTKISKEEQFEVSNNVFKKLNLDGLVIIGGDDSNTNAYFLHEYVQKKQGTTTIVGIPKTIDGDLKSKDIDVSFGFDTACKVYSEMIGNIGVDARSSLKYWHFIKLMGRTASHVTLECALKTRPNIAFIGEEIQSENWSLKKIVDHIRETVEERSKKGKDYGVILIPEGLIEFVPEIRLLISELNKLLEEGKGKKDLSKESKLVFDELPIDIQNQLLQDRDSHGNVQVSKIETEKLLSKMVAEALEKRGSKVKFNPVHHFFGYEGRCAYPSEFDATYCYNLGKNALRLILEKKSGTMSCIRNLSKPISMWKIGEVDLKNALCEEIRGGKVKKVIQKALVDLNGKVFAKYKKLREIDRLEDQFQSPGPMQFSLNQPLEISETLLIEQGALVS